MNRTPWMLAVCGAICVAVVVSAARADQAIPVTDRQDLALTLYNDNLGLVKDKRRVTLARGKQRVWWRDISSQIRPETAQLRSPRRAPLQLEALRLDLDLLTPETLLESYVGREVEVIRVLGGSETRERAVILAAAGPVLRYADRVETGVVGRLAFPGVPDTLHDRPALSMSLASPTAGEQMLELSYLTSGLSWRADYVAALNATDDRFDLSGWATLTNQSGAAYAEARVQLVAGEVHQVAEPRPMAREALVMGKAGLPEETVSDYHVYRLPGRVSLANNQTMQVALMSATDVPVQKTYRVEGAGYAVSAPQGATGQKLKVGVQLTFDNQGAGLGVPLPRGVVRVYKQDEQGEMQFVGEDRIDATAGKDRVRLTLGEAFDLSAERRQTAFQTLSGGDRPQTESAYEIVLKNAQPRAATVTVREHLPGDWRVVSESHPHARPAADSAEWTLSVPAGGRTVLNYRVQIKY